MKRIVAVGHASLDRIYKIPAFPPSPTKVRASAHVEAGGGMAANAAAAAARLGGFAVELWSRTGDDDAGRSIRRYLAEDGIDATYVRMMPEGRSSTSAIIVDAQGERLIVGFRDPEQSSDTGWLPLERIRGAGIVLGDLRWPEAVAVAFTAAREAGVPTLLDADLGGGEALPGLLPLTDYAIFAAPALDLFEPEPNASLRDKLAHVKATFGCRHVGVTRGGDGYCWIDAAGALAWQPAFAVDVIDTTGAGDAFHGAFAWGLVRGHGEADCARIASAAAALKCRKLGGRAALPTEAEVEAFLATAKTLPAMR